MDCAEIFMAEGVTPLRQMCDGFVQTGPEHLVLQLLDDLRILLVELVAQVAKPAVSKSLNGSNTLLALPQVVHEQPRHVVLGQLACPLEGDQQIL
jgi:hypothetical protein